MRQNINYSKILLNLLILFFLTQLGLQIILSISQSFNQHWSQILDQDIVVVYNSLLVQNNIPQEYLDHPAFTTFLLNSYIYKVYNFFFLNSSIDLNYILSSYKLDNFLQIYFIISRFVNVLINTLLIIIFYLCVKKLSNDYLISLFLTTILSLSEWFTLSFYYLRSENLALLLFFISFYFLIKNKYLILKNIIISSIFFYFAYLSKIQIIFFLILNFSVFIIKLVENENRFVITSSRIKKYLNLSFIIFVFFYFLFQIIINEKTNIFIKKPYLDLIIFSLSIILIYGLGSILKLNKNIYKAFVCNVSIFFHSIFLILLITLILSQLNFINFNEFILLRFTNPFHFMSEFGLFNSFDLKSQYAITKNNFFDFIKFPSLNWIVICLLVALLCLIFYKKRKCKNYFIKNLLLYSFIFLLIIKIVSFFYRYYEIYHLFYYSIIMISFSLIFPQIDRKFRIITLFIILILTINESLINKSKIINKFRYSNTGNLKQICSHHEETLRYLKYWTKRLSWKSINNICQNKR